MAAWFGLAGHFAVSESSGCRVVAAIEGILWQASGD